MSKEVLYYPTIEFYDETWLKASLCIWDKIYRIVPPSYNPKDSGEVKIAVDNGLVEDIRLNKSDLAQTAELFELYLEDAPIVPAAVEGWENINVQIHHEKVDARILPILEGMAKKFNPDGFLSISKEVANIYMLFLADVVSKRRGINKLTDDGDMFAIMHYFANDANFDELIYNDEAKEATSALVITSLLPKDLQYMNINEVIKFREKTDESRIAFRQSIDELVSELCRIEDTDFVKERITEFQKNIEKNNNAIIKQAGKGVKDFAHSLLSIGLPTSMSAMSALALLSDGNNVYDLTQIGNACFIGVVSALADATRTKRRNWKNSDSFYYHQLDKVFGSKKGLRFTIPPFHRIYEEFIND